MKRISDSDLRKGIECPYPKVKEAYLTYALQKWLTSKDYGPQSCDEFGDIEIAQLEASLSPDLREFIQSKIEDVLPKVVAQTKGIDFAKINSILLWNWWPQTSADFPSKIAYATLLNLDAYPNAGFNRLPKKEMVKQLQEELGYIEEIETWENLFAQNNISQSVLTAFASWLQSQEKDSHLGFDVVQTLCEQAKEKPQFAKLVFEISLYMIRNFRGYMSEAVECLDDFCQCYPMFWSRLENFLLKNFERYFWKFEPFPHRNPLQYYKEMMYHLTSENLHFSLSWKMKIVQKMLNLAEERATVIYLLDNLKKIYDFQVERADEAYFKAIKTGLHKKEVGGEVLGIVNTFAEGSIFKASGPWWKNFTQYPLAFQKTMVMVYSSSKLSAGYLANAYFSLVWMLQANPLLFDDFEKLASEILARKWIVTSQNIKSFFEPFQQSNYSEAMFRYMEQGIRKLLKIADDEQIEALKGLSNILPQYAKLLEMPELKARLAMIEEKEKCEREAEQERKAEIERLLAKLQ